MRRDKTFAQILLIVSIANLVLTAPALVPQGRLITDLAGDEPTGESGQDSAGLVHQEVVPVAPPPSVGSPAGSEKSLTLSQMWSDDSLLDYLAKSSGSDSDSSPGSPSGSHQDSVPVSGAEQLHGDLPSLSEGLPLQNKPFPWWLHTDWRPPGKWEVGESSHSGPGVTEMMLLPPSGAQPWHDDTVATTPWWHNLNSVTDMDQASTMSWASRVSGWSDADAKVIEETRLHL